MAAHLPACKKRAISRQNSSNLDREYVEALMREVNI
jgi:hypothetical protein